MTYENMGRSQLIELLDELLEQSSRERRLHEGSLDEQQALVHELRVYQVELEMQNRELREAQAEIEQARDRYAALYEFAPVGYLTLSADYDIDAVNMVGALLLGHLSEQLIGRSLTPLVGREAAVALRELCRRSVSSGGAVSAELPLVVQGHVVYVQAVVTARTDATTQAREYLCALIDISDRKRVEEERDRAHAGERTLHERFEALDRLNVAISTIFATEERASVEAVLGIVAENVLGLLGAERAVVSIPLLPGGDTAVEIVREQPGAAALEAPLSVAVPLRLGRRKLGEIALTFDAHARAVLDLGRTLELLADRVALALEIARLNWVEQRERQRLGLLEGAGRALARSAEIEGVHAALVEVAGSAVAALDACSVVYLFEKNGPRVLCASHADPAMTRLLARVARAPGARHDVGRMHARSLPTSSSPALARLGRRLGFTCLHVLPLVARGRRLGAMCFGTRGEGLPGDRDLMRVLQELSGRCAAALDVARLLDELRAAVDSRETLLALVSHDLRSPLNAISLTTHSLGAPPGQAERRRARQQVDLIQRAVTRMSGLVEDLLTAANIDAGHFAVEPAAVSPRELVSEACAHTMPIAMAKGVSLVEVKEPAQLPPVAADRARVLQVLTNLIGNGVKFSPVAGVLRVATEPVAGAVRFCVSDSGPGIAPHERERLFDRYWTGRNQGRGLGLGLFIAERIVHAHGGRLWVESAPGRGASFYFTLPLAASSEAELIDTRRPDMHASG